MTPTTVDGSIVLFGPDAAVPDHGIGHFEDVDDDGDDDWVGHFSTQDTGILCGATEATVNGETLDAQQLEGSDSVNIVQC